MGFYQDLPAGQVSFSEDGSLLAVVFGSKITLWEPEICLLKRSLTQSVSSEEIRLDIFICFRVEIKNICFWLKNES